MICLSSALSVPTQPSLHSPLWLQLKEGTSLEHTDRETDGVTIQSRTKQIKVWSHSAAPYSFSLSACDWKVKMRLLGRKWRMNEMKSSCQQPDCFTVCFIVSSLSLPQLTWRSALLAVHFCISYCDILWILVLSYTAKLLFQLKFECLYMQW